MIVHNNECCKLFEEGNDDVKDYKNACWKTVSEPERGDFVWNNEKKECTRPFDVTTTWTTLEDDEKCVDVDNTGVEVVHNNECCKLFVEGDDTVKDYKNACWKTISEPVATGDAEWNEAEKIC